MAKEFMRFDVAGMKELTDALRQLPTDVQKKLGKGMMQAGVDPILDEARRLVPVKRGDLKRSLRSKIKIDSKVSELDAHIYSGKGGAHDHLVEFGTKPHVITAKKKKVLARAVTGVTSRVWSVFGRTVHHPGARPQPFMRPAFDRKKNEALKNMTEHLRSNLASILRGGKK